MPGNGCPRLFECYNSDTGVTFPKFSQPVIFYKGQTPYMTVYRAAQSAGALSVYDADAGQMGQIGVI